MEQQCKIDIEFVWRLEGKKLYSRQSERLFENGTKDIKTRLLSSLALSANENSGDLVDPFNERKMEADMRKNSI
jgi:hypothetical protein